MPVDLNGRYYSLADAAETVGMTGSRIRQLIREGEIEGVYIGGTYILKAETVAHLIMNPKKRGRRPGPKAEAEAKLAPKLKVKRVGRQSPKNGAEAKRSRKSPA